MTFSQYESLALVQQGGVLWVTIEHGVINLIDGDLIAQLWRLVGELESAGDVRAVVVRSAHPEFFLAHIDVTQISALPLERPERGDELSAWHQLTHRLNHLPMAVIGMVQGRARGGGSELLLAFDMVFAACETALFCQPEVGLGISPGGGATARLPAQVGRQRALEILLGAQDFSAELAERYGWINRALPAAELETFVRTLAERIATFPADALRLTKASVDATRDEPLKQALRGEQRCFDESMAMPEARPRLARLEARYGQQREHELVLPSLLDTLMDDDGAT